MTDQDSGDSDHRFLDKLIRWETVGGTWRILSRKVAAETGRVELSVALCRCDGGEEMERFTTAEKAVLEFVAARTNSED